MLSPANISILNTVNKKVTDEFKVTVEELCSKVRSENLVDAKFVAWWLLHQKYRKSFVIIGHMYKKHHTTILNGVSRIKRDENERILNIAKKIEQILNEEERIQMQGLQPVHSTSSTIQS